MSFSRNLPPVMPSGFHSCAPDPQEPQPVQSSKPGIVKKLAALTFNSGEAFVTVAASWGLRRG